MRMRAPGESPRALRPAAMRRNGGLQLGKGPHLRRLVGMRIRDDDEGRLVATRRGGAADAIGRHVEARADATARLGGERAGVGGIGGSLGSKCCSELITPEVVDLDRPLSANRSNPCNRISYGGVPVDQNFDGTGAYPPIQAGITTASRIGRGGQQRLMRCANRREVLLPTRIVRLTLVTCNYPPRQVAWLASGPFVLISFILLLADHQLSTL